MKGSDLEVYGYYWCTHDFERLALEGGQFPKEWQVVMFEDSVLWRTGTEISAHVSEVPDYVDFYGPLVGPAGAWQPIDTAPKDGTTVIVCHHSAGDTIIRGAFWISVDEAEAVGDPPEDAGWWSYSNSVGRDQLDGRHAPTHWMPLPEPPR